MRGSTAGIQSATAENRRGKKKKEEETTAEEYNGQPYWAAINRGGESPLLVLYCS